MKAELGACDNIYDEQKLQYRVAALSGGIASIKCVFKLLVGWLCV